MLIGGQHIQSCLWPGTRRYHDVVHKIASKTRSSGRDTVYWFQQDGKRLLDVDFLETESEENLRSWHVNINERKDRMVGRSLDDLTLRLRQNPGFPVYQAIGRTPPGM